MPEWAGCPSPACRPPAQCSPEHPANGPPLRPGSVSTAHPCPSPVTRPSERPSCRPVQCPHLLAPPPQGWPAHPRPAPPASSSRPRQPRPARSVRFGGRELAPHRSRGGALLTGTRSLNFDCGWPSHGPGRGPARGPPTSQTSTWGSVGLRIPPLFGGSDVRTWISGPTQSGALSGPRWPSQGRQAARNGSLYLANTHPSSTPGSGGPSHQHPRLHISPSVPPRGTPVGWLGGLRVPSNNSPAALRALQVGGDTPVPGGLAAGRQWPEGDS